MKSRTVHIDGWLYFLCAILAAFLTYVSSEEAYKYINPLWLYWIKATAGSFLAGFNGLKAFRSMTFARHATQLQEAEDEAKLGNTTIITK